MRSDQASVPMRGSRLAGLVSMIITNVFGSEGRVQESETERGSRKSSFNNRVIRGKPGLVAPSGHRVIVSVLSFFVAPTSWESATLHGRRIRNFPHLRPALCAGCGGNVPHLPVPSLMGENGEGDRLFGLRGQPKLVGSTQPYRQSSDSSGDHPHQ